jgi:hypothetical protein
VLDRLSKIGVSPAGLLEICGALRFRAIDHGMEDLLDLLPALGDHGTTLFGLAFRGSDVRVFEKKGRTAPSLLRFEGTDANRLLDLAGPGERGMLSRTVRASSSARTVGFQPVR